MTNMCRNCILMFVSLFSQYFEMFEIQKQYLRNSSLLYVIHTKAECKLSKTFTQIMAMQLYSEKTCDSIGNVYFSLPAIVKSGG